MLLAFIIIPFSVLAQTPAPMPSALQASPTTYLTYVVMTIVAGAVPMLVAVIKVWFPKLQHSYPHVFPILAVGVGLLLVWGINQLTTIHVAGYMGLLLVAAGVGLREVYDQTKQLWPTMPVLTPSVTVSGAGYSAATQAMISGMGLSVANVPPPAVTEHQTTVLEQSIPMLGSADPAILKTSWTGAQPSADVIKQTLALKTTAPAPATPAAPAQ